MYIVTTVYWGRQNKDVAQLVDYVLSVQDARCSVPSITKQAVKVYNLSAWGSVGSRGNVHDHLGQSSKSESNLGYMKIVSKKVVFFFLEMHQICEEVAE